MNIGKMLSLWAAVGLAVVCGSNLTPAADIKSFAVGDVAPIAPDWPAFVAKAKDLYRKHGVDPQVTYVGNVANTVQQMVGGSFGISVSTFDTAIRAIAKGADAVMIGGLVIKYPYSIMSDPTVKTAADLTGKKVILAFQKDLTTSIWNDWVKSQGVDPKSIDQVYDGATPNRYAALAAHQVQAAFLSQPFDLRAADEGYHKLMDIGAYGKDFGFLVILSKPSWLRDHGDEARGYLKALAEAVSWLYDAKNRDEAIKILADNTKLPEKFAAQTYEYYIKDLKPFSNNLQIPNGIVDNTIKALVALGDIKETEVKADKIVDMSYLPK
jgi:ABC-type nitrate/sulfonate/bicarbonate transport system substrate-binding protein